MKTATLNPLFIKEVRTLFRGKGFPIVLNSYLGLVTLLLMASAVMALGKYYTTNAWVMGRDIVLWLGVYQLVALSLIAPALTAAAMSLERDRDTFDVLMVMPLGLARIVFYKTMAALMFLLMLVSASLPVLAGGFVLGGVAPSELAVVALLTLFALLFSGALGLMFSALFQRTIIAVPGACLTTGIVLVVSAIWLYFSQSTLSLRHANPLTALMGYMNGEQAGFFGGKIAVWWLPMFFLSLGFLLCLAIAVEGFRFKFRRNYAAVGAALLALCAVAMLFALGDVVSAMPETLTPSTAFQLVAHLMVLTLFVSVLDPAGTGQRYALFDNTPRALFPRILTAMFRPGLGLTLSACAALSTIWVAVALAHPVLRGNTGLVVAPPLFTLALSLFYAMLGRVMAGLRRWKNGYMPRVITGAVFVCFAGASHVISMILHASDNQATSQPLDILLFVSPVLACRSFGGKALSPYPFLEEILGNTAFYWVTIGVYATLTLMLVGVVLLLNRKSKKSQVEA